jgi:8-oxo-dGTP pyrophosphatase MutT (NUDIX family)
VSVLVLQKGPKAELQVMMIKRAEREGDPWSGHMAFPGGRFDGRFDRNVWQTALRETWEEVGVRCEDIGDYMGRLSDVVTPSHVRRPAMVVTPFVYKVPEKPRFTVNYEVAEIVWVPLEFFRNLHNRETMRWQRGPLSLNLPCYFYQGRRIWGLSLQMLDELLAILK